MKTPGREKTIGRPTLSGFPDWGGGLLDAIPPKGGYSSHLRHWRNMLRPSPLSSKGSSFLTEEGATNGRVIANESVPHDCDRAEWLLWAQKITTAQRISPEDFTLTVHQHNLHKSYLIQLDPLFGHPGFRVL